jgi:hypothetical protein
MIDDGTYDAFIVDAEEGIDDDGTELMHLSVTILSGPLRGDVVDIAAVRLGRSSIDLIGMPATLTVTDGAPSLSIDDA